MEMSLKQRFLTKHYEIEPQHIQTTTPELYLKQDIARLLPHGPPPNLLNSRFCVVTQRSSVA